MPKFFISSKQVENNQINIIGKDVNHIRKVLRKKINDEITICNVSDSQDYLCKIIEITDSNITCNIEEKLKTQAESNINVTIFQGLPKADKMELVIQKSVELGVLDITPVEMKRCVVKLNEKEKNKKVQRWQKISEVAAKQCGRNIIPQINDIISIQNVCNLCEKYDIVLVAYEKEQENTLKEEIKKIREEKCNSNENIKIGILIGPEGRNRRKRNTTVKEQ